MSSELCMTSQVGLSVGQTRNILETPGIFSFRHSVCWEVLKDFLKYRYVASVNNKGLNG